MTFFYISLPEGDTYSPDYWLLEIM